MWQQAKTHTTVLEVLLIMYNVPYLLSSATEGAATECNKGQNPNPIFTPHPPILAVVSC